MMVAVLEEASQGVEKSKILTHHGSDQSMIHQEAFMALKDS